MGNRNPARSITVDKIERLVKLGHWELDLQSNVLYWSPEIYRIFELDANSFHPSYEGFLRAIHPEDRETVNQAYTDSLKTRTPYRITHRLLMADGRLKYVEEQCETDFAEDGTALVSRGTVQDITERILDEQKRKKLEEELFISAKLASIGQLAAGVAHEINNPLATISASLERMQTRLVKLGWSDSTLERYIAYQRDSVDRISQIVQSLNHHLKSGVQKQTGFDPQVAISNSIGLMVTLFQKEHVKLETVLDHQRAHLKGTPSRFQQVLVNLVNNARDATRGRENPRVTVTTCVSEGKFFLEVRDNGSGIREEVLPHIFEAFFTTKDPREGTGLGLSIARQIIDEMGGRVHVKSKLGVGTQFLVSFPLVEEGFVPGDQDPSLLRAAQLHQPCRVLFAEDEPEFRHLISSALEEAGYTVVSVGNGREALERLRSGGSFDLLLTDLAMPELTGYSLIKQLDQAAPDFKGKIVILSGQSSLPVADLRYDLYLRKPLSVVHLLNALSDLLEERRREELPLPESP